MLTQIPVAQQERASMYPLIASRYAYIRNLTRPLAQIAISYTGYLYVCSKLVVSVRSP